MDDAQTQRLAKLKPGEAFLFFGKLDEPEEIKTEDYRLANNINITLSDDSIKSLSTYWNGRQEKLRPYPECGYCPCCAHGCDYARRILGREIARRIFVKNFKPDSSDFDSLKEVFAYISKLVNAELNDELFNKELLLCSKCHLWRKIKYGSRISVTEQMIRASLEK
jgi:hypothetical protein